MRAIRLTFVFASLIGAVMAAGTAFADPWNPNDSLPDCGTVPYFSQSLIDLSKVAAVTPPGLVNSNDHFIPIHVMYFGGKQIGTPPAFEHPNTPVVAPGNVVVTAVEWQKKRNVADTGWVDDWYITFATCKQVRFRIHHMSSVGTPGHYLADRAIQIKNGQSFGSLETWCNVAGGEPSGANFCVGLVNDYLLANSQLGRVFFDKYYSFNLSVKDYNPPPTPLQPLPALIPGMPSATGSPIAANYGRYHLSHAEFQAQYPTSYPSATLFEEISPSRTKDNGLYVRCQADYFPETERLAIKELFGKAPGMPMWPSGWGDTPCGRFLHDEPFKIKGSWFHVSKPLTFIPDEKWAMSLFYAPHGNAPVISVGLELRTGGYSPLTFPQQNSGTVNVRYNAIQFVPGGPQPIYCYDSLQKFRPGSQYDPAPSDPSSVNVPGVYLFQFQATDTEIKMEYQPWVTTGCPATPAFSGAEKTLVR